MAAYKCVKCGVRADSKCAFQRSIFCEHHLDGVMSNVMKRTVEFGFAHEVGRRVTVHVHYSLYDQTGQMTESEAVVEMLSQLAGIPKADWSIIACHHQWSLQSPTCDLGCCTRKEAV